MKELLNCCVCDNQKKTQKLISDLCEIVVLSAVGCEMGIGFDIEKNDLFKNL